MRAACGLVTVLALIACGIGSAAAQERFDLRDWNRKTIPNSPTAFFECGRPSACGAGSAVSGRLTAKPASPLTIDGQRAREQQIIRRMREQGEGRIRDIVLGETRETQVESMPLIYTEKQVIPTSGAPRIFVDGVLVGKTKAYTVVASGVKAEQTRDHFMAFVRVVALILDQMALDAAPAAPAPRPGQGGQSGQPGARP